MSQDRASAGTGPLSPEAARAIHEEHEELKVLLRQLNGTTDIDTLVPLLVELRTLLADHFEHEEAPSSLGVGAQKPRFESRVREIFEEHRQFLKDLDGLVEKARRWVDGRQAVLTGIADLARRLHEHEAKEAALMLDFAETDLGGRG